MMNIKNLLLNRHHLIFLMLLVLLANLTLYYTTFGVDVIQNSPNLVVIVSIVDLAIISPILFITWLKKWNIKNIIIAIATGLILVRLIIPFEYLRPYVALTWAGFLIEGIIVIAELYLIFTLFQYVPQIRTLMKNSSLPTLFKYPEAIEKHLNTTFVMKVLSTEFLMLYYAFASWRKQQSIKENEFTIYKNSSLIATYVLVIHSILIETIVLHWWLYSKFPIISVILLILNVYTIFFLLGNLQAIRHNPIHLTEKKLYLSFGLVKRMMIGWGNVEEVIIEPSVLNRKLTKDTIDFIAREFEQAFPHVILKLKQPTSVDFVFGIEKKYKYVAIRVDDRPSLRKLYNYILRINISIMKKRSNSTIELLR